LAADLWLVVGEAETVGLLTVPLEWLPLLVGVVVWVAEAAGGAVVVELELEDEPAAFWYWLTTKSTMSLP
jgi:hypothetical protein